MSFYFILFSSSQRGSVWVRTFLFFLFLLLEHPFHWKTFKNVAVKKNLAVILIRAWNLPFMLKDIFFQKFPEWLYCLAGGWEWGACTCPLPSKGELWSPAGRDQKPFQMPSPGCWRQKVGFIFNEAAGSRATSSQAVTTNKTVENSKQIAVFFQRLWEFPWKWVSLPFPTKEKVTQGAPLGDDFWFSFLLSKWKVRNWGFSKEPQRQVWAPISHFSKRQPICWKWKQTQPTSMWRAKLSVTLHTSSSFLIILCGN